MTEKLAGLVVPVLEPLGYKRGWGMSTVARIREEIPEDLGRLTLRQEDINSVLACGGLWQGKEVSSDFPAHMFMLRRDLVVRIAKEYLEAAVVGEALLPMPFVRQFLRNEANFDPLTATWLFLQNEFERAELEGELAMCIAHLVETWPQILDGSQITLGPVVEDIAIGDVVLHVDTVDITYGDHRLGVEVNWPGSVLVRLVPNIATPRDLEEMALGALVHGIATGCPPQRLVVWGLQSGKGIGMDVERDWLELAIASTQLATQAIGDIRNDRGVVVQGGEHCTQCPFSDSCDVSEADDYPF
ncbi:MAG: hypothetical protein RIR69_530 [Actinomycetota bacterium]|jgi:hypothetical protein